MKRRLKGVVVSDKTDKTISVSVENSKIHPLYRKRYKVSNKFLVHDPKNQFKIGDFVEIEESKPISKRKKWKVVSKEK